MPTIEKNNLRLSGDYLATITKFPATSDYQKFPQMIATFTHTYVQGNNFILYICSIKHLFENSKISRSKQFLFIYDTIY